METTTNNSSKATLSNKDDGSKRTRKPRNLSGLPTVSNARDAHKAHYEATIDRTQVEFDALDNYEVFSTADDGSMLMVKVSRSKAARLSDRKVFQTNGGRVYRVLSLFYSQIHQQNQNQGNG